MRTFRGRLLILGYPLVEIVTIYLIGQAIGWLWTSLLILAGFPIGFALMRNAGDAAMRDMVEAAKANRQVDASAHTLSFVGGLLIMVPGFWSDLVGLLLTFPVTQRLFRTRVRSWFEQRFTAIHVPGARYPSGDVIQGTVISTDGSPPATAPRPPLPGGSQSG
jgi:UPF0716 protein FxsA